MLILIILEPNLYSHLDHFLGFHLPSASSTNLLIWSLRMIIFSMIFSLFLSSHFCYPYPLDLHLPIELVQPV